MDGMLSQDEINALLSGMDLSGGNAPDNGTNESAGASAPTGGSGSDGSELTDVEKDAIGEVANISMGSSATTLYTLVNRKVNITTPVVSLAKWDNLIKQYEKPCVFIQIKYTSGLDGSNILVLKEQDVKVITDLMMGGDGTNTEGELGELHLSAISEAMNQMMGSSATSLSTMLKKVIDISPPESTLLDFSQPSQATDVAPFLDGEFVKIEFRMQIDELVDSTIMQLYPLEFAKELVDCFIHVQTEEIDAQASKRSRIEAEEKEMANTSSQPAATPQMDPMGMNPMGQMGMNPMDQMGMNPMGQMGMNPMGQMGMNPMGQMGMNPMGQMGMNPMGQMGMNPMGQMGMNPMGQMGMSPMGGMPQMNNVDIQPARFQNFSGEVNTVPGQENIGIIMDVPLEVTVELGRTTKSISDILNFAPGTIIELERIAGEPIDVLVNGKFVAKGEVVVIEESFAIRITEIIK